MLTYNISVSDIGASFSIKYTDELGIDPKACLESALNDISVKRLRLMSYWDIHEPKFGVYDFKELDWQFRLAKKHDAKVSLAVGLRQPRWPESHWPDWAKDLPKEVWQAALTNFIKATIHRYKNHPSLESWQLENEALLKSFGLNGNFDRTRLRSEYDLIKKLDPNHPIIMTTSDSWGIPIWGPKPDMYGISIYRRFYDRGRYRQSHRPAQFYKFRGVLIKLLSGKPVFIHELQTEPWGPGATVDLSLNEQAITMNEAFFSEAVLFARQTGLMPIYLWGVEWWYWLKVRKGDDRMWLRAQKLFV